MQQQVPQSTHLWRLAVIGAGVSGLSAAIALLKQGCQVTVYEAAPQAGGRARAVKHPHTAIDNGQHLCLGAYHAMLALLTEVGVSIDAVFLRLPLALHMQDGAQRISLVTPTWLPAPLHVLAGLLAARGLHWRSKWQAICWMLQLRMRDFRLTADCSVHQLLADGRQTAQATRVLWEPLCLAALNTPIHQASAQVFLTVLRDSLMHQRSDSDFLIARQDLTHTLIAPLVRHIEALGGEVKLGCAVQGFQAKQAHVEVTHADGTDRVDRVIVAVGPHQTKTLGMATTPDLHTLPITTVYLQFSDDIRLPTPMMGLTQGWAQWMFDRGQCCQQPGLLAVVISAHERLPDRASLIADCVQSLQNLCRLHGLPVPEQPLWVQVITEKRATFACHAGIQRPAVDSIHPLIYLAGDMVENGYPATIEGAVRNGLQAASTAIAHLTHN